MWFADLGCYIFWNTENKQWAVSGEASSDKKTWVKLLKESNFRPSTLDFRRTMSSSPKLEARSSRLKKHYITTLLHYIFFGDDGLWVNKTTSRAVATRSLVVLKKIGIAPQVVSLTFYFLAFLCVKSEGNYVFESQKCYFRVTF